MPLNLLQLSLLLIVHILVTVSGKPRSIPSHIRSNCAASCVVSCPEGWQKFQDQCFLWSKNEKNWLEAEKACQSHGGHLASVTDEEIHGYVMRKGLRVWIGGTDEAEKGKWVWADCSAWGFESWLKVPIDAVGSVAQYLGLYAQNEDEHCVEIFYKEMNLFRGWYNQSKISGAVQELTQKVNLLHGWNDQSCAHKQQYVCSKKICSGKP